MYQGSSHNFPWRFRGTIYCCIEHKIYLLINNYKVPSATILRPLGTIMLLSTSDSKFCACTILLTAKWLIFLILKKVGSNTKSTQINIVLRILPKPNVNYTCDGAPYVKGLTQFLRQFCRTLMSTSHSWYSL